MKNIKTNQKEYNVNTIFLQSDTILGPNKEANLSISNNNEKFLVIENFFNKFELNNPKNIHNTENTQRSACDSEGATTFGSDASLRERRPSGDSSGATTFGSDASPASVDLRRLLRSHDLRE